MRSSRGTEAKFQSENCHDLKKQTLFLRFIQGYLGFHLQKIYIVFEQAMLLQKNTFMREDPLHVFLS